MKGQFVKYINTMGDSSKNMSPLTLEKEYEIEGEFSWNKPNDCYFIKNDLGVTNFYYKKRFSEPYNK